MKIYRSGQPIELTQEEMQAAYAEVHHQCELKFVRDLFLEHFGERGNEVSIPSFSDTYGFTPEDAVNPDSEHYLLEQLLKCYNEYETSHVAETSLWDFVFHKVMDEMQQIHEWITDAQANASIENGITMYYYKLWVEPRHSDSYPVYVKSDKALTPEETMEKAREDCYMFTVEDGECLELGNAITKEEYDNRLDPDEYLDCDGECLGCDRACADRIPYPEV